MQFAFSEMMWVDETLLQEVDGLVVVLRVHGTFGELQSSELVLCRNLTFTSLPWVEDMGVDGSYGTLVLSCSIH